MTDSISLPDIVNTPEFAGAVLSKYAGVPVEGLSAEEYQAASEGIARGLLDFCKTAGYSENESADYILRLVAAGMGAGACMMAKQAVDATSKPTLWDAGKKMMSNWADTAPIPEGVKSSVGGAVQKAQVAAQAAAYGASRPDVGVNLGKGNYAQAALGAVTPAPAGATPTWVDRAQGAVGTVAAAAKNPEVAQAASSAAKGNWGDAASGLIGQGWNWLKDPNNISKWAPYAVGGLGLFAGAKALGAGNGTALAAGAAGALAAPHLLNGYQAWQSGKAPNMWDPTLQSVQEGFKKLAPPDQTQKTLDAGQAQAKDVMKASQPTK